MDDRVHREHLDDVARERPADVVDRIGEADVADPVDSGLCTALGARAQALGQLRHGMRLKASGLRRLLNTQARRGPHPPNALLREGDRLAFVLRVRSLGTQAHLVFQPSHRCEGICLQAVRMDFRTLAPRTADESWDIDNSIKPTLDRDGAWLGEGQRRNPQTIAPTASKDGAARPVEANSQDAQSRRSGMDQLDVASGCCGKLFKILMVDCHDLVPVGCEQHDAGIDDVGEPDGAEELPSFPTKWLIERADIDSAERLRQAGLTRAAAPHLSKHPGVGQREVSLELSGLQADPHRAFIALERDQGAAVENEGHADFALRVACRRPPRTTVASRRSARLWAAISSALISPDSFS